MPKAEGGASKELRDEKVDRQEGGTETEIIVT